MDPSIRRYKENELEVTERRLYTVNEGRHYFLKNWYKVLVFIVVFSLISPNIGSQNKMATNNGTTVIELLQMSYFQIVMFVFIACIAVCTLAHFIWDLQDSKKIKRLEKYKRELELELGLVPVTKADNSTT